MDLLHKLKGFIQKEFMPVTTNTGPDGFVWKSDDQNAKWHALIDNVLRDIGPNAYEGIDSAAGLESLINVTSNQHGAFLDILIKRLKYNARGSFAYKFAYLKLLYACNVRNFKLSETQVYRLIEIFSNGYYNPKVVLNVFMETLTVYTVGKPLDSKMSQSLVGLIQDYHGYVDSNEMRRWLSRIFGLAEWKGIPIDTRDVFGKWLNAYFKAATSEEQGILNAFFKTCDNVNNKLTRTHLKAWKEVEAVLGPEISADFVAKALDKLSETTNLATKEYEMPWAIGKANLPLAQAFVLLAGQYPTPEMRERLINVAVHYMYLHVILCNNSIRALGQMSDAAPTLMQLRSKLKQAHRPTLGLLEETLTAVAAAAGLSTDALADSATPDYGLTDGVLRTPIGDYTAVLTVENSRSATLQFETSSGKIVKSAPKALKEAHKDELAALTKLKKEILMQLTAQRERFDGFYLARRSFSFKYFRENLEQHGLMGVLVKRLIWRFGDTAGIRRDGRFEDAAGRPLEGLNDDTEVTLWHPLMASVDEITAWRDCLDRHEITQPFKQAYREIYVLTDAERRTESYSNRMAAHILRQYQFNTLAKLRGWRYALLGGYDDGRDNEVARRVLPQWDFIAEFWIDPVESEEGFADSGIWLYVSTDQVRFLSDHRTTAPLERVPALLFSEIMRDVDLFVGVASIGNDPNWADAGGERRHIDYWHNYSFGDLGASAKTRRELLERLVPRLAIKDRCTLTDKFLVVRGDLRTYKIHLGSGNILMEPNDQYLCIVPNAASRNDEKKVFLPFEGDGVLSIILSKAFLLADDAKIIDPTIVRQIK